VCFSLESTTSFENIEQKVSIIHDMHPPVLNSEQQVSPTSEHLLCVENVDIEFNVHDLFLG